jgi:SAM-dependent methyltransferase
MAEMRWQTKCLLDNCKAVLPFQNSLRTLKRRMVPYRPSLSRGSHAIAEGLMQIEWLEQALGSVAGRTILEIGSGWEPILPVLFSLHGAAKICLTDQTRLLDLDTVHAALEVIEANAGVISGRTGITPKTFKPSSVEEFLTSFRLAYLAPCDCRSLSLSPASVDAVISRSVFEHIPGAIIQSILAESYRVLRPGGVACHFVDNSDHWQHRDNRISRVNFLRYSDAAFRWTCLNEQNYQNRLRHPEYVAILRACGFDILRAEGIVDQSAVEALRELPLDTRFNGFSPQDLATVDSYLLAQKPGL